MTHARVRYDLGFVTALVLSVIATIVLALVLWKGNGSLRNLGDVGTLWLFTVVGPNIQAFKAHRRLGDLVRAHPEVPEPVLRDLLEARSALPFFGGLAAAWALALGLGR